MVGNQQAQQAPVEPEGTDPAEPSAGPWWRSRRTVTTVALGLAALLVGVVLFTPDRGEGPVGDRSENDRASSSVEEARDDSEADTPDPAESDGDGAVDDSQTGGAEQQQRDPSQEEPAVPAPPAPDGGSAPGEAELPNLDITPDVFRDRWNVAIRDLGRGYPLDEIVIDDPDFGSGGDMVEYPVEQPMEAFGRIEVRIRSDRLVSSAVVEAEPTDAEQQEDYEATLAAAVAGVTGGSAEQAADLLATDLGLDGTADPNHHVAGTEVDGVVIQIEAASGLWSFYIGGPWTG